MSTFLFSSSTCAGCSGSGVAPIDLSDWTQYLYPEIQKNCTEFGADWNVQEGGNSVLQTINGQQTMFCSPFKIFDEDSEIFAGPVTITGQVRVEEPTDGEGRGNDYWGFALGFNNGDEGIRIGGSPADYVLIDWMQESQRVSTSCLEEDDGFCQPYPGYDPNPGGSNLPVDECGPVQCQDEADLPPEWNQATVGLAASQVRGLPHADLMWSHQYCPAIDNDEGNFSTGDIQELKRGRKFGNKGWEYSSPSKEWYDFRFDISSRVIRVYVDDQHRRLVVCWFGQFIAWI